ncbi:MAG: tetratricopeptide repeat protein [bacterium]|nr:tetratricopeptide repeat protein [bacterium]
MSDLEDRISECRRRWTASPESRAFIPLADALRQAGLCDEALAVLEKGLTLHPRALGGLVTLARTLSAAGRAERAATVASRILEQDPDNLVALEMLGEDERRRGDTTSAIGYYERLAQLEPGDRHWSAILAGLRAQRDTGPDESGDPDAGLVTLTLVDLYLAQGYRLKAEAMLRRLAAARPDDPALSQRLAQFEAERSPVADLGSIAAVPVLPAPPTVAPASAARREQSREQFASWIERLRAERGAAP